MHDLKGILLRCKGVSNPVVMLVFTYSTYMLMYLMDQVCTGSSPAGNFVQGRVRLHKIAHISNMHTNFILVYTGPYVRMYIKKVLGTVYHVMHGLICIVMHGDLHYTLYQPHIFVLTFRKLLDV